MTENQSEDPLAAHEADFDDEENSTVSLVALADAQDRVIELLCNYRSKLRENDFSEDACEVMTIQYHQQLRS